MRWAKQNLVDRDDRQLALQQAYQLLLRQVAGIRPENNSAEGQNAAIPLLESPSVGRREQHHHLPQQQRQQTQARQARSREKRLEQALKVFAGLKSRSIGMKISQVTFARLLSLCSGDADLDLASSLFFEMCREERRTRRKSISKEEYEENRDEEIARLANQVRQEEAEEDRELRLRKEEETREKVRNAVDTARQLALFHIMRIHIENARSKQSRAVEAKADGEETEGDSDLVQRALDSFFLALRDNSDYSEEQIIQALHSLRAYFARND